MNLDLGLIEIFNTNFHIAPFKLANHEVNYHFLNFIKGNKGVYVRFFSSLRFIGDY